jgi:hypothetical protein
LGGEGVDGRCSRPGVSFFEKCLVDCRFYDNYAICFRHRTALLALVSFFGKCLVDCRYYDNYALTPNP